MSRQMEGNVRTIALWCFGLVGSFLLGGLIGGALFPPPRLFLPGMGGTLLGSIGGMCLFASLRLWLGSERK